MITNNINDRLDYSGNTSSTYSAAVDEEFSGLTRRTQVSVSTSHVSSSDPDMITGSMTDDEEYNNEYTSGYESRAYSHARASFTYDEFSSGSPNSDELSSTFMSYYIDNVVSERVRSLFVCLQKPIVFFSLLLPGSNLINALGRVAYDVTVSASRCTKPRYCIRAGDLYVLPRGYTHMPECLQRARLSVPCFVESFVKKVLECSGVSSLADLQKRNWSEALRVLKLATNEIVSQQICHSSKPMIPLAVFLPVFSLGVIAIARGVISRQQEYQEYEDDEEIEFESSQAGNQRGASVPRSLDAMQLSGLDDSSPNVVSGGSYEGKQSSPRSLQLSQPVDAFLIPPRSHGERREPSDTPTNPQTVPTSRDLSPESCTAGDAPKVTLSPTLKDPQAVQTEIDSHRNQYNLRGDVVVALVGDPSALEVEVLLMAAAKYQCRKVIVPSTTPGSVLASLLSTDVVQVNDVMEYVMSVEEGIGMTTVGVFLRAVTGDAEELRGFRHPSSAVYVFVPAMYPDANVIAHLVDRIIYHPLSLDEPFPINVCLYDRLTKERQEIT